MSLDRSREARAPGEPLTVGRLARRLLGKRQFARAAVYYRRAFVDLAAVARAFDEFVPPGARVLDVGGGDGAMLDALLTRRPDVTATMIDLAADLGNSLSLGAAVRTIVRPRTSIRDYLAQGAAPVQAILLCDVVHHVPLANRNGFFADLHDLIAANAGVTLLVKDIEPAGLRAKAAFLADRYISGDRNVSFISREEMRATVTRTCGTARALETSLYRVDAPNYALIFA